jgi:hypothetical protein
LCLRDDEVIALARLGKRLKRLHGAPQDIEFAIDRELPAGQDIVLLECRPVTVLDAPAVTGVRPLATRCRSWRPTCWPRPTVPDGVLASARLQFGRWRMRVAPYSSDSTPSRASASSDWLQRALVEGERVVA